MFPHKDVSSEEEKKNVRKNLKVDFMQRDIPFRKKKKSLCYCIMLYVTHRHFQLKS